MHVEPEGRIMPGTCAGIVLGQSHEQTVGQVWTRLDEDHASRPIVGALAAAGPAGLLSEAQRNGFRTDGRYADKCHLCWSIRSHLAACGLHGEELGPRWMYVETA